MRDSHDKGILLARTGRSFKRFFRTREAPAKGPLIPAYHAVAPAVESPFLGYKVHCVHRDVFREQMQWIKMHFDVLSVDELVARAHEGTSLAGTAAITFDDGYRSIVEYALPVLEELVLPATVYLTGAILEEGGVLWRDLVRWVLSEHKVDAFLGFAMEKDPAFGKVRQEAFYSDTKNPSRIPSPSVARLLAQFLASQGIDTARETQGLYCNVEDLRGFDSSLLQVGNHGFHHYVFSSLPGDMQEEEIVRGQEVLAGSGLAVSRVFSLPNGTSADYNSTTLALLRNAGYAGLLLCEGSSKPGPSKGIQFRHGLVCLQRFLAPEVAAIE